ncbi:MAG: hypothetical protein IKU76_07200 [Bacteroidaceae bacterium]|nr:hypothetical protein [Bacteroidaceae bacterium]
MATILRKKAIEASKNRIKKTHYTINNCFFLKKISFSKLLYVSLHLEYNQKKATYNYGKELENIRIRPDYPGSNHHHPQPLSGLEQLQLGKLGFSSLNDCRLDHLHQSKQEATRAEQRLIENKKNDASASFLYKRMASAILLLYSADIIKPQPRVQ